MSSGQARMDHRCSVGDRWPLRVYLMVKEREKRTERRREREREGGEELLGAVLSHSLRSSGERKGKGEGRVQIQHSGLTVSQGSPSSPCPSSLSCINSLFNVLSRTSMTEHAVVFLPGGGNPGTALASRRRKR